MSATEKRVTLGNLQIPQGELILMYNLIKYEINPLKTKALLFNQTIFIIALDGTMLTVDINFTDCGVFNWYSIVPIGFGVNGEEHEYGFDKEVELGDGNYLKMIKGPCHPYILFINGEYQCWLSFHQFNNFKRELILFNSMFGDIE